MKLFDLSEDKQVLLNKPWIFQVPEFKALIIRDRGSAGDYRGDKKLKATREFTYIYFFADFSSPIRDYDDDKRQAEALYYAGLTLEQIDEAVITAQEKYTTMQIEASRPLRTLKALYKGMDAMDEYFENIDFKKTDKQGKLLNDPSAFVTNAGKLNKMYDEIRNFEKRVEDDLRQAGTGIRGPNSTLGDNEGQKREWSELDIQQGSTHAATGTSKGASSFEGILKITQQQAIKERKEAQIEIEELSKVDKNGMAFLAGGEEEEEDEQ